MPFSPAFLAWRASSRCTIVPLFRHSLSSPFLSFFGLARLESEWYGTTVVKSIIFGCFCFSTFFNDTSRYRLLRRWISLISIRPWSSIRRGDLRPDMYPLSHDKDRKNKTIDYEVVYRTYCNRTDLYALRYSKDSITNLAYILFCISWTEILFVSYENMCISPVA